VAGGLSKVYCNLTFPADYCYSNSYLIKISLSDLLPYNKVNSVVSAVLAATA